MEIKYPFSMMNVPRQKSFGCFSLRIGSIVFGLLLILYCTFEIALCSVAIISLQEDASTDSSPIMLAYSMVITALLIHVVTLLFTTVMLIGVLKQLPRLVKPWIFWTSIQLTVGIFLFIFGSAMSAINQSFYGSLVDYIIEFLLLMARFYILMGVASYHSQLEEESDDRLRNLVTSDTWMYNAA